MAWRTGESFMFYIWVHRRVGMNEGSFLCLQRMYSEPCPICEQINHQLRAGATNEEINAQGLWARSRILVQCIDRHNEEAGIQIWDVSQYQIDEAIRSLSFDEHGQPIDVTHYQVGYDLLYDYEKRGDFPMPKNLQLSRDHNPIAVEWYAEVFDFDDDVLLKPSYDEVYDAYYGPQTEDAPDYGGAPTYETPAAPAPVAAVPAAAPAPTAPAPVAAVPAPAVPDPTESDACYGREYGSYMDCDPGFSPPCEDIEACKAACEAAGLPVALAAPAPAEPVALAAPTAPTAPAEPVPAAPAAPTPAAPVAPAPAPVAPVPVAPVAPAPAAPAPTAEGAPPVPARAPRRSRRS